MTPTDCNGIAAFHFANLSGSTQEVKKSTHMLGNCLNLLLTDVLDVVNFLIDPPLDKSNHSFFYFILCEGMS